MLGLPPLEPEELEELLDELLDELDDDEELLPPVEVLVDPPVLVTPPVLVLVEPPLVELPPDDVLDDPPLLVEEITTLPPPELPPPKNPPKKPPELPPYPPLPPITTGTELPPSIIGGAGGRYEGKGTGIGCAVGVWAIVTTVGWQAVTVFVTVRRVRLILRAGSPLRTIRARTGCFLVCFFT